MSIDIKFIGNNNEVILIGEWGIDLSIVRQKKPDDVSLDYIQHFKCSKEKYEIVLYNWVCTIRKDEKGKYTNKCERCNISINNKEIKDLIELSRTFLELTS